MANTVERIEKENIAQVCGNCVKFYECESLPVHDFPDSKREYYTPKCDKFQSFSTLKDTCLLCGWYGRSGREIVKEEGNIETTHCPKCKGIMYSREL